VTDANDFFTDDSSVRVIDVFSAADLQGSLVTQGVNPTAIDKVSTLSVGCLILSNH